MHSRLSRVIRDISVATGLVVSTSVAAEEAPGRVRHIEPGVTVQRAFEAQAEEAEVNLPFLPGDRMWTNASGRAEIQFEDGSLVRIDRQSRIEFQQAENDHGVTLALQSGSLSLRSASSDLSFAIDTPAAFVTTREPGVVRIDVRYGETRVSTLEGEALVEARGARQTVRSGERTYARSDGSDVDVAAFDPNRSDDFADWVESREQEARWSSAGDRYLPEELSLYASEFDSYGDWRTEPDVGHVWYPRVDAEWSPYSHGRWVWTSFGWTWVPEEHWGWAACHYGRWGYSMGSGWYWIPSRTWGPAWVSWSIGDGYVGWRPLGWRNHHMSRIDRYSRQHGWRFVQRHHFGGRGLSHRYTHQPHRAGFMAYSSTERRPGRDLARWEQPRRHAMRHGSWGDRGQRSLNTSPFDSSRRMSARDRSTSWLRRGSDHDTRSSRSPQRFYRNERAPLARDARPLDDSRRRASSSRSPFWRGWNRDGSTRTRDSSAGETRTPIWSRTNRAGSGERSYSNERRRDVSSRFFQSLRRSSDRNARGENQSGRSWRSDRSSGRQERNRSSSSSGEHRSFWRSNRSDSGRSSRGDSGRSSGHGAHRRR